MGQNHLHLWKHGFTHVSRYPAWFWGMEQYLQSQNYCGTCYKPFQNQHVHCRTKNQKPHHHESRCVPCRNCKPAYCHRCIQHELSTVHPKPQTFNCLKKYSIVIVRLWACKSTPKIWWFMSIQKQFWIST